jgi:hypothetical protein
VIVDAMRYDVVTQACAVWPSSSSAMVRIAVETTVWSSAGEEHPRAAARTAR